MSGLDIDLRADVKDHAAPRTPRPPHGPLRSALAWLWQQVAAWAPSLLLVLVLRDAVIEPFQIPSGSMVPTLAIGDFILVSKFGYGVRIPFTKIELLPLAEPARGDVVVFLYPPDLAQGRNTDYIKRIVALPGDDVSVRDDVVYVNGVEQPRAYRRNITYADPNRGCGEDVMKEFQESLGGVKHPVLQSTRYEQAMADYGPATVPPGHYFVMGDNRDNSSDSRVWGFVPRENIRGKAKWVWLSFDQCEGNIRGLGGMRWDRLGTAIH
ncbi:MAG: hypothetical protein RLZZ299_1091 [Pseudomonadota bacterium]